MESLYCMPETTVTLLCQLCLKKLWPKRGRSYNSKIRFGGEIKKRRNVVWHMKTELLLKSGQRVQSRIETSTWPRMTHVRDGGLDEGPRNLASPPAASLLLILSKSFVLFRCHSRLSRPLPLRQFNWHGIVISVQFPHATWLLGCCHCCCIVLVQWGNWKELQAHSFKFCLALTRGC